MARGIIAAVVPRSGSALSSFIFSVYTFTCLAALDLVSAHEVGSAVSLCCVGSSVVECRLLVEAGGIQFPDQGSNPGPLWEHGVLDTVSPGKFFGISFVEFWK